MIDYGEYQIHTFSNGIRLVHRKVQNTKIAHCGFILDIGSRDELPHQQGIAHFWEHMAFKGTAKRNSFHILNSLESLGGELNAYTTKEKICFYASFLENHYARAVEILTDITFNATFPEKQLEREKKVILEEMAMYLDAPEEAISDDFEAVLFAKHPLGNNILGTPESVASFQKKDFEAFMHENLDTSRIIFSSVANFPIEKAIKLTEKYIAPIPAFKANKTRKFAAIYTPKHLTKETNNLQAHCMIGSTAYGLLEDKRLPFYMLINILGGPALNSRLNFALREKHGFVYSVEASYTPFIDTGIWSIYFATEKKRLNKSIALILKELNKLQQIPLGKVQLRYAKEQLIGQLAMAEENNASFMLMMGKSMLDLGRIEPLEEIFEAIHKVTTEQLQELAKAMFAEEQLSILKYLPD